MATNRSVKSKSKSLSLSLRAAYPNTENTSTFALLPTCEFKGNSKSHATTQYLLFVFTVLLMNIPQTVSLEGSDVSRWAQLISADLIHLSEKGLRYKEIQRIFDKTQYTSQKMNGMEKITELSEKFGKFLNQKQELVKELAQKTASVHDAWILSQKKSQNDQKDLANLHHNSDNENAKNTLRQLCRDVYQDADFLSHFNQSQMIYDNHLRTKVNYQSSFVKIPDDVARDSQDVVNTVNWSVGLNDIFIKNHRDPDVRLQYFGSTSGILRGYPGMPWKTNFVGFAEDFDPRVRPWYLAATTEPKSVVIILDASASMEKHSRWKRAKAVAIKVLESLSQYDYVNVIASHSKYWTNNRKLFNYTADTLSCLQNTLVPANALHRGELINRINDIKPDGGSDHFPAFKNAFQLLNPENSTVCQQMIIFISDGKNTDRKVRCDPGHFKYDDENRRHYKPGEICKYKYDILLKSIDELQSSPKIPIFTFLTTSRSDYDVEYLPGHLACNNGGAMSRISDQSDIISQMTPYFSYLQAKADIRSVVWSPPYVDSVGLGLTMTATLSVYSNMTSSLVGVVGIDISLTAMEALLLNERWGSAYTFLVDKYGHAIIHPFIKPSAQLIEDPRFISIVELETVNGEPEEFVELLDAIQYRENGTIRMQTDAQQVRSVSNGIMWRKGAYSDYFFTPVTGSDFTLVLHMDEGDETFRYAVEPDDIVYNSYLHHIALYNHTDGMENLYKFLKPSKDHNKYRGMLISKVCSVVSLAPDSFCDSLEYKRSHKPSFANLHHSINGMNSIDKRKGCKGGIIKPNVRSEVHITSKLEPLWRDRDAGAEELFMWTYIGTTSGLMRIYPGVELQDGYDPRRRPWYKQAVYSHDKLSISGDYRGGTGQGKVVTLSKAVYQDVSHMIDGLVCDEDADCLSGFCYEGYCKNPIIEGVAGLDMSYPDFNTRIQGLIRRNAAEHYCGAEYICKNSSICKTSCYLVDQFGYIVSDKAFSSEPDDKQEAYQHIPLAAKEGHVFAELVKQGVFVRKSKMDYQAVCSRTNNSDILLISTEESTPFLRFDRQAAGPHPTFVHQFACTSQVVFYTSNTTVMSQNEDMINGSLVDSPCTDGFYHFTVVPKTNLFFLVIQDQRPRNSHFDFNCQISKSVLLPGSFGVSGDACLQWVPSLNISTEVNTCKQPYFVASDCLYGTASILTSNHASVFHLLLFGILVMLILHTFSLTAHVYM